MPSIGLPNCYVDIYPNEGGSFRISGNNGMLRECTVSKHIRDINSGTFTLLLAPGGPFGPNGRPAWQDIITPMSLVVIGMARGARARIVMIGVVRSVSQSENWTNDGVDRPLMIAGRDFGYFFTMPNFYAQYLYQFSSGALLNPGLSLGNVLALGTKNSTIVQTAQTFYNKIMAGTKGLLSNTNFDYQGSRVNFPSLMASKFEAFPNLKLDIPVGENFMIMQGAWSDTFRRLYPFPWFEFFIATSQNDYGEGSAQTPISLSTGSMKPASPAVIARPMPFPAVTNSGTQYSASFNIDLSLWEQLPSYTLDTLGPISHVISFDDVEVRNLYVINPQPIGSVLGVQNGDITPFMYNFASWLDSESVERYGYRPFIANLSWFADPDGAAAKKNAGQLGPFQGMVADIALKSVSYFEPSPMMARGTLVTNLRPDIPIGVKFEFTPYKGDENWEFYVVGVDHRYAFGVESATTLTLERGLPSSVYSNSDTMKAMLTGNAMRKDGKYQIGLPSGAGKPLMPLNLNTAVSLTTELAKVYEGAGMQ